MNVGEVGREGLVLGGSGDLLVNGKMDEKSLNFGGAHLLREAFVV